VAKAGIGVELEVEVISEMVPLDAPASEKGGGRGPWTGEDCGLGGVMLAAVEGTVGVEAEVCGWEDSGPLRNHDFHPPPLFLTLLFTRSFQCCLTRFFMQALVGGLRKARREMRYGKATAERYILPLILKMRFGSLAIAGLKQKSSKLISYL